MDKAKDKMYRLEEPLVGIIMGSHSDLEVMSGAAEVLESFGIPCEVSIVSAHRTPEKMFEYARSARERGLKVIIAGAGGSAHLPGMVASLTSLPVIGVPIKLSTAFEGWDSLLSIVQMPGGVPVATVAVNGGKNAGVLAAQILGVHDKKISGKMIEYKKSLEQKVIDSDSALHEKGWKYFLRGA